MSKRRVYGLAIGLATAVAALTLALSVSPTGSRGETGPNSPGSVSTPDTVSGQPRELPAPDTTAVREGELSGQRQAPAATANAPDPLLGARAPSAYGKLPLTFEANQGQTDPQVKFVSRGRGYTLFLTPTEAVLALRQQSAVSRQRSAPKTQNPGTPTSDSDQTPQHPLLTLRMKLVGANPEPEVHGLEQLRGKANYFIGNDPTKWRTNVPTYAKVEYQDVYPGVNLVYYGNQRQLEHDFIVAPGADPKAIQVAFEGAETIETGSQGDLILKTAAGEVRLNKPLIYQVVAGARRPVPGGYVLSPQSAIRNPKSPLVGFQVAAYDTTKPLIIDPVLIYSTYLGGSSSDFGTSIAVDATGHAYVTGQTCSTNFPPTNPLTPDGVNHFNDGTGCDAFVTKFNVAGTAHVYSTYLGGKSSDIGNSIAVDAFGSAHVTGKTCGNFPTTDTAFQKDSPSNFSCTTFVTKLNATGSALLYSTFLSGSSGSIGNGIAVHPCPGKNIHRICIYVTGGANSGDFPTTPSAFQAASKGGADAFVSVLDPLDPSMPVFLGTCTGDANKKITCKESLFYSTFLSGTFTDEGESIAVDPSGNAYVTGNTLSTDPNKDLFPTKNNSSFLQTGPGGSRDAFVAKIDPSKSGDASLVYSTFVGGSNEENGTILDGGIAVDAAGNAYVTGTTISADFKTTPGAFQGSCHGTIADAFMVKLKFDPQTSTLTGEYATCVGGSAEDHGTHIAVDSFGHAYVTGYTVSSDFPGPGGGSPTRLGVNNPFLGTQDVFVVKIDPSKSGPNSLVESTILDGSGLDLGFGIAVDSCGNAYVTGQTASVSDFPLKGAEQPISGGGTDAFVAKIGNPLAKFCHAPLAYISHNLDFIAAVIETDSRKVVDTVVLKGASNTATPVGPGVAVHPDGTRAYVTIPGISLVQVIDTTNNTVKKDVPLAGTNPIGVAVHPSGAWVYVANFQGDPNDPTNFHIGHTISVIGTDTDTVIDTIDLLAGVEASGPFGVAVHPDGTRVYVTNALANFVTVIDVAYTTNPLISTPTHKFIGTVKTGLFPLA